MKIYVQDASISKCTLLGLMKNSQPGWLGREEECLLLWKTLQKFCELLWIYCACTEVILLSADSQKWLTNVVAMAVC